MRSDFGPPGGGRAYDADGVVVDASRSDELGTSREPARPAEALTKL